MKTWRILFFWLMLVLLILSSAYYGGIQDEGILVTQENPPDALITYDVQIADTRTQISINKSIFKELREAYTHRDVEYLYCLRGDVSEEEIKINKVIEEKNVISYPYAVFMYETPCNYSDCVGTLHPHYSGNCSPSQEDISFWRSLCDEEDMCFHMIQCGAENVRGYLVNNAS